MPLKLLAIRAWDFYVQRSDTYRIISSESVHKALVTKHQGIADLSHHGLPVHRLVIRWLNDQHQNPAIAYANFSEYSACFAPELAHG